MNMSTRALSILLLMIAVWAGTAAAATITYPTKPIRLIIGFPPGGANDIVARIIAQQLTDAMGQQVVVDNRPGASGVIANELAAKTAPDGYTMLLVPASFVTDATLRPTLPYHPVRDFTPISLVATAPLALVVSQAYPARSVQELIALAKSKPGQLNFAHSGTGNMTHLAGELFKILAGVDIVAVAYKGGPPALTDLMGGQVQMQFPTLLPVLPLLRSGRLRALAVTSAQRSPALPDVPTIAESGVPGYEANGWWGILAPNGVTRAVVTRLNREIVQGLALAKVRERLSSQGADAHGDTPEEFGAYMREQSEKWAKVIKRAGIRLD